MAEGKPNNNTEIKSDEQKIEPEIYKPDFSAELKILKNNQQGFEQKILSLDGEIKKLAEKFFGINEKPKTEKEEKSFVDKIVDWLSR